MARTVAAFSLEMVLVVARVLAFQDGRDAAAPAPADPHPHPRVRLDVAHVGGLATLLGDDPERVGRAVEALAHGRAARLPALAARRLEQRDSGCQPIRRQRLDRRVEQLHLQRGDEPPLALRRRHGRASLGPERALRA